MRLEARRPAGAARRGLAGLRARRLRALKRLQGLGGARRRNPKAVPNLGTVASSEEIERMQALLEDGYTVMLTPLIDQVVIATVDLDRLVALIGDPRSLH